MLRKNVVHYPIIVCWFHYSQTDDVVVQPLLGLVFFSMQANLKNAAYFKVFSERCLERLTKFESSYRPVRLGTCPGKILQTTISYSL